MPLRSRLQVAAFVFIAITGIWVLTATWGVSDVVAAERRNTEELIQSLNSLIRLGPFNRIDFDPDVRPSLGTTKVPWYFVGNASCPFPLIVAVDRACQLTPLEGWRSRSYVLWLFGFKVPLPMHSGYREGRKEGQVHI